MKKGIIIVAIILIAGFVSCVSTGTGGKAEPIVLHAIDAQLKTSGNLVYEAQAGRECIGWWESPNDEISWDFEVVKGGEYKVTAVVACATSFVGSEVGITVNGETLTFIVPDTFEWSNFVNKEVGTVTLEPGSYTVVVKGIKLENRFFGNLQKVIFEKVG
jgi:hypothetical protein